MDNSCRREGQVRKGRQVYLGGYDKEDKAARAYDLTALKYWGYKVTRSHLNLLLLQTKTSNNSYFHRTLPQILTLTLHFHVGFLLSLQFSTINRTSLSIILWLLTPQFKLL